MLHARIRLVVVSIAVIALFGCSKKDHEAVSKDSNGTDSFHYTPDPKTLPDAAKPADATPAASPAPAPAPKPAPKGDGSAFSYKPNPKYLPANKGGSN